MSTSPEPPPPPAGSSGSGALSPVDSPTTCEPLACVSCRSRKLKCDRKKPVCTRCSNAGGDCVYPESRRKPAFKRRNVRELEERLAQVEGLLKNVGKHKLSPEDGHSGPGSQQASPGGVGGLDLNFEEIFSTQQPQNRQDTPSWFSRTAAGGTPREKRPPSWELQGLGQFESMPPFEMIEELHTIFFETQNQFMPLLQRNKYLREFHSPPHMRPPMCLQYAVWTMAALDHPKYGRYHGVFYRRSRQYLEADELRGYGEHFVTVAHAQAWALIASNEARCMLFTRGAMSSARCVRLVGMIGLNRLDCTSSEDEHPLGQMIVPPRDWVELEERRRAFWGAFCIDSYASVSTGWPTMIDLSQVTTHLPASEDAYASGKEEKSSTLPSVFVGSGFSNFAGNIVVCSIFNQLMKHCHRPLSDDHPENFEYGKFWERHRELDNTLSSAFMFLPERLRLPENMADPVAVQTNLNLHAAVIRLHNVAIEKAEKYGLPGHIKQASSDRSMAATKQVTEIVKVTGQMKNGYKSPLMALSLYCAATAHLVRAKDAPDQVDVAGLEVLVKCMDTIGKHHIVTRAYFNQIMLDLEHHGIYIPTETPRRCIDPARCANGIPLVARSSTSRHSKVPSPFPSRLPSGGLLGPGYIAPTNNTTILPAGCRLTKKCNPAPAVTILDDVNPHASKRARTSAGPSSGMPSFGGGILDQHRTAPHRLSDTVDGWPSATLFGYPSGYAPGADKSDNTELPYRSGSPALENLTGRAAASAAQRQQHENLVDFSMCSTSGPASFGLHPLGGMPVPTNPRAVGVGGNPNDAIAFVPAPRNMGTNTATSSTTITNININTNNSNNNFTDNMDMFHGLENWEVPDPEAYYAMVADMFRTGGDGGGGDEMATEASSQSNHTVEGGASNTNSSSIDPWGLLDDGSWDTTTIHGRPG